MTRFTTLSVAAATALTLGALDAAPASASVLTPAPISVAQDAGRDCAAGPVVPVRRKFFREDECAAGPFAPSSLALAGYRHP